MRHLTPTHAGKLLLLVFLALGALLLPARSEAAPLLQPGKKTLFQRVVSHPNALLYASPNQASEVVNKGLRPFTALYVYERANGWLNVGASTSKPQGWIKEELSTPWNQSLTLLFTPRTGRDPVLFFKDMESLKKVCESDDLSVPIRELQAAAASHKEDSRIIAAEPSETAVSRDRFYLMPILDVREPFDGTKFLRVAAIDPGNTQKKKKGGNAAVQGSAPKTAIAMVIDTTISMGPYIQQSLNVAKTLYDRLEKESMAENVGFGVVAFRSSTATSPQIEYTSKVVSDFTTVKNRAELERQLSQVKECKVSTHDFNEDSFSGVYEAVESLSWQDYSSRIILLVSDAGPLQQDDRYVNVRMGPQELQDFAKQKGIWVVVLHVKTPSGKSNHAYAEEAYRALSKIDGTRSNYQPIKAPDPKTGAKYFGAVAGSIAGTMVTMVRNTAEGKYSTKPPNEPGVSRKQEEESPEASATAMAERIGYAMQLEFLGRKNQSSMPKVVDSWISDMDLVKLAQNQQMPNVETAVLLTKNQLSDLRDQIQNIIDNAERTKKTDSGDFFQGILSASAQMARDPNAPTQGKTLAELGVLGEFLEGLPYKSEVMLLKEEDWYRKSIGEQTAFINRLKSKVARYEEYDRDRANWESFGVSSAGDWVYRIPLNMLP